MFCCFFCEVYLNISVAPISEWESIPKSKTNLFLPGYFGMVHPLGTSPMYCQIIPFNKAQLFPWGVGSQAKLAPLRFQKILLFFRKIRFDAMTRFEVLNFKDMPSYSRPMKIHVPNASMFASIFAGHTSGFCCFLEEFGGKK